MITEEQKQRAIDFFWLVQDRLGQQFEAVDGKAKIQKESWDRPEGGGGTMAVIRGDVVEKAGVNVSVVHGDSYPALEGEYAGKPFFAAGVSTITHMYNPYAPIGHANVRLLTAGDDFWFGGGADLTPMMRFDEDTEEFHQAMKDACRDFSPNAYEDYAKWCDEYFYIQHRKEIRGVGGIFFDHLKGEFENNFEFIQRVANAYVDVFPKILKRRKDHKFTEKEKEDQLYWRGRYAEYNLVYDRGTKFGLLSGGNWKAIFVSLPPVVKW